MPQTIEVTTRQGELAETSADTRVVGLFEDQESAIESIDKLVETGEVKASYKSTGVVRSHSARFVTVGLGKKEDFTTERARVAGAVALGAAKGLSANSLAVALPAGADGGANAGAFAEGAILKNYVFDAYKTKSDDEDDDTGIMSIEFVGDGLEDGVRLGKISAEAANRARDLQNQPSNVATPTYLSDRAAAIAAEHNLEFDIHDRQWIENKGMGAFAAVAKGTPEEPQLIVLKYNGAGATGPTLGFVGKAVTFDTGGISLKPSGKMEEMKFDMSGGAAVLEATAAIAQLGLPINLISVVPSTENMPGGRATKPGDIVTALNGKTIEIDNTDAEGRLILADALTYTIELGAERIVNLATLTGAIIVALGSTYAGIFSNDDEWAAAVEAAGDVTGELGHRLPLHPEFAELIKGKYADISNAPGSRKGSSITAAEFLKNFVGETPWTHLDIAGTAWDLGRTYVGNGASGFGTRLLIELAREHGEG
ncbi:MAG: leucyl aminopeptidase [Thermoleophilaceae bacterium]|nr:leucyl aminopeptidase [Thermoleophilaceae bacterium]